MFTVRTHLSQFSPYLFIFPSFYGNGLVSKTQPSSNFSNNICSPPPGLDSIAPTCSFAVPIAYLIFVPAGILAIGAWCSVHYGSDSGPDNYEACELYYVEDGDNLWNIAKSKFPKADNNIDVVKEIAEDCAAYQSLS